MAIVTSLVLVFSGLIALLWGVTYNHRLVELHSFYATNATREVSDRMEERLRNIFLLAFGLRYNPVVQDVLQRACLDSDNVSLADMDRMRQTLISALLNTEYVTSAAVICESDAAFFTGSNEHLTPEVLADYRRQIGTRDTYWMVEGVRDTYGYPTLVLMTRLRLPRQSPQAWLVVRIRCREMLYRLNNATADRSTLVLMGEGNQIVHSENLHLFHTENAEELLPFLVASPNIADQRSTVLGKSSLVITNRFAIVPWTSYVVIPLSEISSNYRSILMYNLLLLAAVIAIAVLITLGISQKFLRNIRLLTRGVEQMDEKSMELVLPIRSNDEVSVLYQRFGSLLARINQQMDALVKGEREKRLLGLKALQAQMDPHFLYNSLNTIRLLAKMQGATPAVEAVDALSEILRVNMSRQECLTFAQEMEYLRKYIALKEFQSAYPIRFVAEIEEGLEHCYIMKMLLQPLVENAFKHGGIMDEPGGYISVCVSREGRDVCVYVEDNGKGLSAEDIRKILAHLKHSESIGLFNIMQRIRLHYGDDYGVQISGEQDVYTCVTLRLPRIEALEEQND